MHNGECAHIGRGVWLEPDATNLVWCDLCGALSRDGGETWERLQNHAGSTEPQG